MATPIFKVFSAEEILQDTAFAPVLSFALPNADGEEDEDDALEDEEPYEGIREDDEDDDLIDDNMSGMPVIPSPS